MKERKNKKQAAEELAQLHARTHILTKELRENVNSITRLFLEKFPETNIAKMLGMKKKNDLVSDQVIMQRLNELVVQKQMHLATPVTSLKDIARELNVTQKRIKTMFARHPEHSNLSQVLCHHRILTACKIMEKHPNYTIEAISRECGFTNRKSFYRWFAIVKGCTPTEYMKRKKIPTQ